MGSPTVIVRACIISLSQTSGCVGWVAHRLLVSCSVLGVAVKPVLLTYLLTQARALLRGPMSTGQAVGIRARPWKLLKALQGSLRASDNVYKDALNEAS